MARYELIIQMILSGASDEEIKARIVQIDLPTIKVYRKAATGQLAVIQPRRKYERVDIPNETDGIVGQSDWLTVAVLLPSHTHLIKAYYEEQHFFEY